MTQKKVYDKEFKIQAVKLGREIGFSKAAKEIARLREEKLNVFSKHLNPF